ncbi:5-carboxymethyl-2-hydroxymuconate Delta-isomerase [Alkalibacillus haloalkaliphilus]|uniref:5-carboxymethyl-2-hydroxymuconate Delta-isomerase n=1 Tax=Alkalibacillus haloalkaliphilus TaxID=94136 RepID=UPI002935FA1F|nr:5-carboxymethyl-2-hydroxymuconate Delta-isomerase [Alkalibacillus haloalkaliphilus]MDV2582426.1 5-carboxymethyl-2-hydroxymuconate Delta-isomerase [Alkalibacillus haloalkaliphilus]
MPHFILEYTDNLQDDLDVSSLLKNVNEALLKHDDIIPIGGLRSRAIELKDYVVADGKEDDAFVHAILKLGKGRTDEEKRRLCDELYETITKDLEELFNERYMAFSLELFEFTHPTYKKNNIHERYRNLKKG